MHSVFIPGQSAGRSGKEASNYARELYRYANGRLDDHSLFPWMTQPLMLDCGLDHADARSISDTEIDACRKRRCRWGILRRQTFGISTNVARRLAA